MDTLISITNYKVYLSKYAIIQIIHYLNPYNNNINTISNSSSIRNDPNPMINSRKKNKNKNEKHFLEK